MKKREAPEGSRKAFEDLRESLWVEKEGKETTGTIKRTKKSDW